MSTLMTWVGFPTNTALPITVQTNSTAAVRVKVATNAAMTTGVRWSASTVPDAQGYSQHVVSGLTAGTQYWYQVEEGGAVAAKVYGTNLKTAPVGTADLRLGLGSCTKGGHSSAALTGLAARGDINLVAHLGDLYYHPSEPASPTLTNYRQQIQETVQSADHRALLGNVPTRWTWSDHDFGLANNVQGVGFAGTAAAQAAARQVQPILPGEYVDSSGIYSAHRWGRILIICTDNRSFKSPMANTDNSSKTVLGTAQKAWFKNLITTTDAALIVWMNEQPWIGPKKANEDKWMGYSTERTELGNFIATSGKNVVIVSGDMHTLAADDGSHSVGGIMVCQASPFNQTSEGDDGTGASNYVRPPYPAAGIANTQQYGVLDVVDSGTTITVKFTGHSADGTQRMSLTRTYSAAAPNADAENQPPTSPGVAYNFGGGSWAGAVAGGFTASDISTTGLRLAETRADLGYDSGTVLRVIPGFTTSAAAIAADASVKLTYDVPGRAWTPGVITLKAARGGDTNPRGFTLRATRGAQVYTYAERLLTTLEPTWETFTFNLSNVGFVEGTGPVQIQIFPFTTGDTASIGFDQITLLGTPAAGTPAVSVLENNLAGPAGTAVTVANSDDTGGTPVDTLTTTPAPLYNDTGDGWRVSSKGTLEYGDWTLNAAEGDELTLYVETKRNTDPANNLYALALRSGGTNVLRFKYNTSGIAEVDATVDWVGTDHIPGAYQWVLHAIRVKVSATNGEYEYRRWNNPADYLTTPSEASGAVVGALSSSLTTLRLGNTTPTTANGIEFRNLKVVKGGFLTAGGGGATVDAGPDISRTTGSTITITATASATGGTWLWERVSGSAVTLVGANTPTVSFVAPSEIGSTTLRVTWTPPGGGAAVVDTVLVQYELPAASAPVWTGTPLYRIDASATPGTVTLAQVDGPQAVVATPAPKVFEVDLTGVGQQVVFELSKTDAFGQTRTVRIPIDPGSGGVTQFISDTLVYDSAIGDYIA